MGRRREGPPKPFFCTECPLELLTAETLGLHLETHREVGCIKYNSRGRPVTRPCPHGCGRPLCRSEMREHVSNCDGSSPAGMLRRVTG